MLDDQQFKDLMNSFRNVITSFNSENPLPEIDAPDDGHPVTIEGENFELTPTDQYAEKDEESGVIALDDDPFEYVDTETQTEVLSGIRVVSWIAQVGLARTSSGSIKHVLDNADAVRNLVLMIGESAFEEQLLKLTDQAQSQASDSSTAALRALFRHLISESCEDALFGAIVDPDPIAATIAMRLTALVARPAVTKSLPYLIQQIEIDDSRLRKEAFRALERLHYRAIPVVGHLINTLGTASRTVAKFIATFFASNKCDQPDVLAALDKRLFEENTREEPEPPEQLRAVGLGESADQRVGPGFPYLRTSIVLAILAQERTIAMGGADMHECVHRTLSLTLQHALAKEGDLLGEVAIQALKLFGDRSNGDFLQAMNSRSDHLVILATRAIRAQTLTSEMTDQLIELARRLLQSHNFDVRLGILNVIQRLPSIDHRILALLKERMRQEESVHVLERILQIQKEHETRLKEADGVEFDAKVTRWFSSLDYAEFRNYLHAYWCMGSLDKNAMMALGMSRGHADVQDALRRMKEEGRCELAHDSQKFLSKSVATLSERFKKQPFLEEAWSPEEQIAELQISVGQASVSPGTKKKNSVKDKLWTPRGRAAWRYIDRFLHLKGDLPIFLLLDKDTVRRPRGRPRKGDAR